jgi:anti-sigma B factor antagonist
MAEGINPSWQALAFRTEERPEAIVLHPSGEVDLSTVSSLWSMLKSAGEDGRSVIVMLSGVTYIDSTGIKAFLDVHRLFRQRAQRLVLADPTSMVRKVIEITALEKIIPVYPSLDKAVTSLRGPGEPKQGA